MCWFGDPLPSKACRVGALNLGGYGTRSHSIGYGRTTLSSWRPFRLVRASRRCYNWFILLEWVPPFPGLPSSLDEDFDDSELDWPFSSICTEDELSHYFCLLLDFLDEALSSDFFLSSSNYASICLRASIYSCWVWIILNCSLWIWACCSKRLAVSSRVFVMYAKASFFIEEFEACDSAMAECDSLTSMPRARAL